jgi:hypothetical protein
LVAPFNLMFEVAHRYEHECRLGWIDRPRFVDNRVVAVGYGRKDPRDLRGSIKQRDHIRKAMEYTRYWFRIRGYGIRPFGDT